MSDEYHQNGVQGSLVNPSIVQGMREEQGSRDSTYTNMDYETGNYPPQSGDSTSSGGWSSTTPHPDTNPTAKDLHFASGTGTGTGLVGSNEPQGVDTRAEDAHFSPGSESQTQTQSQSQSQFASGEERSGGSDVTRRGGRSGGDARIGGEELNRYSDIDTRADSIESVGEAEERLGSAYDAERGSV